jgi:SAM-dependent methyltransferase
MPSLADNFHYYNDQYSWPRDGDEWSDPWGSALSQWESVIQPRIESFLDVDTILEIAPGRGRWTQFLRYRCKRLIVADISPRCIDACRKRFRDSSHIEYQVTDGLSLPAVETSSIDFVFSFDSLVHADLDVLLAYLGELKRILRPTGASVLHHSNLGAYPERLERPRGVHLPPHRRSDNVSADVIREACGNGGLCCLRQELLNWRNVGFLLDCLSTIRHASSQRGAEACTIVPNMAFMSECREAAAVASSCHRSRAL